MLRTRQIAPPTRRCAILGLGALGLSSCLGGQEGVYTKNLKILEATFGPKKTLKRADVGKFQAASIAVNIGGRADGLVLLNRIEGRDCYWLSPDHILLVTRAGRLMETSGLRANLAHTSFPVPDPVDGGLLTSNGVRAKRLLDYDEFGVQIEARALFQVRRKEPINILGSIIPTVRVTEDVRVHALKWGFTNTYWVHEQTAIVWRSRQHFHPDYGAMNITTMRPVAMPGG